MELGQMGFKSPRVGGRGLSTPLVSSKPLTGDLKPVTRNVTRDLGTSSIASATTGGGAPPVKNLGAKIISALRARRRGLGAPRGGRRL
jgi:hypothetical protein